MAFTGSPVVFAAAAQVARESIGETVYHLLSIVVYTLGDEWCLFVFICVLIVVVLRRQKRFKHVLNAPHSHGICMLLGRKVRIPVLVLRMGKRYFDRVLL